MYPFQHSENRQMDLIHARTYTQAKTQAQTQTQTKAHTPTYKQKGIGGKRLTQKC